MKILSTSIIRAGSRAAATSKMERFVIIVNGFQPLTIITKRSILDVAAALDLPLIITMLPQEIKCQLRCRIYCFPFVYELVLYVLKFC